MCSSDPSGRPRRSTPSTGSERGERGVPGGAFLRAVPGWLGADRLGWMVVAVQLPVGADVGGPMLPFEPVQRVIGYRAESADRPVRRVLSCVLPDPFLAGVHRGGQLGEEPLPLRVGDCGHALGPGPLRLRHQRVDLVAGSGRRSRWPGPSPRRATGSQSPAGPRRRTSSPAASAARSVRHSQVAWCEVSSSAAYSRGQRRRDDRRYRSACQPGGLALPHRVQQRQVIGVGQRPALGLQR